MGAVVEIEAPDAAAAEVAAAAAWALGATAVEEAAGASDAVVLRIGAAGTDLAGIADRVGGRIVAVDDRVLDAWQAHAQPVVVGRVLLQPDWVPLSAEPNDVIVRLPRSRAFGTGSHPTTRMCLQAIQDLDVGGRHVTDVGSGTGVLAVAAAALGADDVEAVDIDPVARAATAEAGALNEVDITVRDAVPPHLDVVVANLSAATLVDLAPALAAADTLVLSGALSAQVATVAGGYLGRSFTVDEDSGWVCLLDRSGMPPA